MPHFLADTPLRREPQLGDVRLVELNYADGRKYWQVEIFTDNNYDSVHDRTLVLPQPQWLVEYAMVNDEAEANRAYERILTARLTGRKVSRSTYAP